MQTELHVISIRCISRADTLPFEVTDAARSTDQAKDSEAQFVTVSADTRLDNRCIDLRTPVNQAIFHLQSKVCQVSDTMLRNQCNGHWACMCAGQQVMDMCESWG